ncbi:MAG TPA: zinc ABC transporter substrate-binding protein, partial [Gemmata sp.]|nr:zinc ABC transporter substrate-binding protein [Gemmata sp.]
MFARVVLCVWVAVLAGLGLAGCNGTSGPPKFEELPVRVTCTTTIVADVVTRVGGDRVQVDVLMGPGVDPHQYIMNRGDQRRLDAAHLVFFNGLHLEGKMADLFEKNRDRWRAYALAGAIDPAKLIAADVDGGEYDPHVWFDVRLWAETPGTVRDDGRRTRYADGQLLELRRPRGSVTPDQTQPRQNRDPPTEYNASEHGLASAT